jgi:chemotaxis regulatin CheY-phosphate phosphatase CheZ
MKRKLIKILKRLSPESAARMRRRIRAETALKTIFYQGANPIRDATDERAPEVVEYTEEAAYRTVTKCRRVQEHYLLIT